MQTFPPPKVLRFEDFSLDLTRCALRRGDLEVPLRPKAFDVLRYLAERADRLVSKDELMKAVWPDVTVTDGSLVQCIKDIREALSDNAHRIIKTVPRRGYVLAADVLGPGAKGPGQAEVAALEPNSTNTWFLRRRRYALAVIAFVVLAAGAYTLWPRPVDEHPAVLTMMSVPSIAVMPLRNSAPGGGAVDAALAEEIGTELARVPRGHRILIKSAAAYSGSVMEPKAIGRRLGVRYLVLGSVRGEGSDVQLNVHLIEAETGRQVWGHPFSYHADAAGARQRVVASIARLATERLTAAESQRPLPAVPKADHYAIMGRALTSRKMNTKIAREALDLYQQGLAIDAASVPALQGYARTKISMVLNGWVGGDRRARFLDDAEAAILRVIDQEPANYGAFRLLGSLHRARNEPLQAIAAFEHAVRLNSSYASAHAELGRAKIEVGRSEEAIAEIRTAIAITSSDPQLYIWCFWAGQAALHSEDYEAALDWFERSRQANPSYDNARPWIAVAHAGLGRIEKARAEMQSYRAKVPSFSIAGWNELHPRQNEVVAAQRARIAAWLHRLSVPEVISPGVAKSE